MIEWTDDPLLSWQVHGHCGWSANAMFRLGKGPWKNLGTGEAHRGIACCKRIGVAVHLVEKVFGAVNECARGD